MQANKKISMYAREHFTWAPLVKWCVQCRTLEHGKSLRKKSKRYYTWYTTTKKNDMMYARAHLCDASIARDVMFNAAERYKQMEETWPYDYWPRCEQSSAIDDCRSCGTYTQIQLKQQQPQDQNVSRCPWAETPAERKWIVEKKTKSSYHILVPGIHLCGKQIIELCRGYWLTAIRT